MGWNRKNRDLESGRSESSSKADWLHNPEASYSPSPTLSSTSYNPYFRSVRELNEKEPLAPRGKCFSSMVVPFSFPQRAAFSATLWYTICFSWLMPPHDTHTHTTLTGAVSLRLVDDNPNLCPKTLGSRVAEAKPQATRKAEELLHDDPSSPKPAQTQKQLLACLLLYPQAQHRACHVGLNDE